MTQCKTTPQFKRQLLDGSAALMVEAEDTFARFNTIRITRDKDKLLVTALNGDDAIFTFDPISVYDTMSLTIDGLDARMKLHITD